MFLILLNFGWMVDLAMSIFEFLTKFLVLWHPWHPWVCIRSVCWKCNLKQIEAIPPSVRHILDNVKQWHFHSTSNEVTWRKKISNYMQGLKTAILVIFQTWLCPVSTALKNPALEFKNSFWFGLLWIPSNAGWQN